MAFFTPEEEKKLGGQFWNDGVTRRVTIEKDWRPSKTDPEKQLCYIKTYDVDEKKEISFLDFNFLNTLKKLPEGLKYDNMILKVTPTKTGERDWNGKKFDIFDYTIEATGEFAAVRAGVDVKDIEF